MTAVQGGWIEFEDNLNPCHCGLMSSHHHEGCYTFSVYVDRISANGILYFDFHGADTQFLPILIKLFIFSQARSALRRFRPRLIYLETLGGTVQCLV